MKSTTSRSKKYTLGIVGLVVVLLLTGSYFTFAYTTKSLWPFQADTIERPTTRGVNDVNYNPPTEQDIEQSQTGKEKNAQKDENTKPANTSTVDVAISFAEVIDNQVQVRAFIPGVIEGNGRCTVTATQGNLVVQTSSVAFVDATSTQCTPIYIERSSFTNSGAWDIVVSYSSTTSTGSSEINRINL